MFLYKLEASGQGFPPSQVIVVAADEEAAFLAADALLEKNALGFIEVEQIALVEKKRLEASNGYVLELK